MLPCSAEEDLIYDHFQGLSRANLGMQGQGYVIENQSDLYIKL